MKRFEIGDQKVALERSEHAYIAVIGVGLVPTRLSASLKDFLADVEGRYGRSLESWSGIAEDLPGVRTMLEAFADGGRYRRGDWRDGAVYEEPLRSSLQGAEKPTVGTRETAVPEGPLPPQ